MDLIYLEFYKTSRGDSPVTDYIRNIDDLDESTELLEMIERVDSKGAKYLISAEERTRDLGDGLWEIKKSKHRLYYVYCSGNRVYMLHACYKQKDKAEKRDLEIGKKRMKEIKIQEKGRS